MDLYYNHVFVEKKSEYLTEAQLKTTEDIVGPILVDFDFRYNTDVTKRQHTKDHIVDMVSLYMDELKQFLLFDLNTNIQIYIFEKPNINSTSLEHEVKDGIHMVIGIQLNHIYQQILRKRIIEKLKPVWDDLPLTNNFDSILDSGISKGVTNWQLLGSKKPNNEAYQLKYIYTISMDDNHQFEYAINEIKPNTIISKEIFKKSSARYKNNPKIPINPEISDEYQKFLGSNNSSSVGGCINSSKSSRITYISSSTEEDYTCGETIPLETITNYSILNTAVKRMLKSFTASEYNLKEIHEYTQILPEKYYESGSHLLNREVAFALKHTDERLFLSWVLLRSKADDFDYNDIPNLYKKWTTYFNSNNKKNVLTFRSIIYWAKNDAFEEYTKIRKNTINYYIDITVHSSTDYDFAMVLYQLFSDKYVCASIKNNEWYVFNKHRWELDKGTTIRLEISQTIFNLYVDKLNEAFIEETNTPNIPENEKKIEILKNKIKRLREISLKLKSTASKNNIMKEASSLFYDNNFIENIDSNKYLLGFTNGVIDFSKKCFRAGVAQDYLTKSTKIPYINYSLPEYDDIKNSILEFMEKLYPIEELCRYMWDHLASSLIGTNINQTFNIYIGSGSNGKSMLTKLMGFALGDYAGTVPLSLITEKRGLIGGTSSEIMQLKGIRYAIIQEPSKGMKINEGTMKELTGGDPLQGRSLFHESETFDPQFTLAVCTNVEFDIYSNDEGTWRRIRRVPHLAKFVNKNYVKEENENYVFEKDEFLEDKLETWSQVFISMLVERAFSTNGKVEDCNVVMEESIKYRQSQDNISAFVNECVRKSDNINKIIRKRELIEEFKVWFGDNSSHNKIPKSSELNQYMDKKFKIVKGGWCGCYIYHEKIINDQDETLGEDEIDD